jgi:hypothetical protein
VSDRHEPAQSRLLALPALWAQAELQMLRASSAAIHPGPMLFSLLSCSLRQIVVTLRSWQSVLRHKKPAADLSARACDEFSMMPLCQCFARRVKSCSVKQQFIDSARDLDSPLAPRDVEGMCLKMSAGLIQ